MGNIGNEVASQCLRRAQFPGHEIKIVVNVADDVNAGIRIQADRKITCGHLLQRFIQPGDWGQDFPAEHERKNRAENNADQDDKQHDREARNVETGKAFHRHDQKPEKQRGNGDYAKGDERIIKAQLMLEISKHAVSPLCSRRRASSQFQSRDCSESARAASQYARLPCADRFPYPRPRYRPSAAAG